MAPLTEYRLHATLWRFRARVAEAERAIREAAEGRRAVVSLSWGKDSTALAHLVLSILPTERVTLLHFASSYRLPGFERVRDAFARRAEVVEIPPARGVEETIRWLREVGLGYERDARGRGLVARQKHDIGRSYLALQTDDYVSMLGLRADESLARRWNRRARGLVYRAKDGTLTACPLASWSAADVWAYIASRGVPYHPLYDLETHGQTRETLRNSGWLTTIDVPNGRAAWLRQHFPAQFRALREAFPRIPS